MMNWRFKLILMNCAIAVALYYRWSRGAAMVPLVITGLIMFLLVNVLVLLTAKRSGSAK
jgi:predicted Na+-dependent transporter